MNGVTLLIGVLSAVISSSASIIVCVINNRTERKRNEDENRKNAELIAYRINELEKKQDRHNELITRVTTMEIYDKETRKDVDELFKRLRELEKGVKA